MGLSRSGYYYQPCPETEENLRLMLRLDQLHLERPVYGSRRLVQLLQREGWRVNRKRVTRKPWPVPPRRSGSCAR